LVADEMRCDVVGRGVGGIRGGIEKPTVLSSVAAVEREAWRLRDCFDQAGAFTVGVEEELVLVDPVSFGVVLGAPDLLRRLGDATTGSGSCSCCRASRRGEATRR
jgi:hypothetical protein